MSSALGTVFISQPLGLSYYLCMARSDGKQKDKKLSLDRAGAAELSVRSLGTATNYYATVSLKACVTSYYTLERGWWFYEDSRAKSEKKNGDAFRAKSCEIRSMYIMGLF